MLFGAQDDEDDFTGGSTSSTKLASLFGADQDAGLQEGSNQSLVYRPPKQPQPAAKAAPTHAAAATGNGSASQPMSVIHAGIVHAYRFESGSHVGQGKLGVAIVGRHDSNVYRLLLYRGKQQPVATAHIGRDFAYTVQSNNYANFYDEKRQSWSILFDTEQAAMDCAKQVGLARFNSCSRPLESAILSQDVAFGRGPIVNGGDLIAVKYIVHSLINHSIGPALVEETKAFVRMHLGAQDNVLKDLDEGLVGATRGSTRLVIVPPSQKDQSASVYTVQVAEVLPAAADPEPATKLDIDNNQLVSSPSKQATPGEEATVRARGASISEQLQLSPKTDKAKIISRMAKMGQQMLPPQAAGTPTRSGKARSASAAASSESDEDTIRAADAHSSPSPEPVVPPRPRARNQQSNSNLKRAWELQQLQLQRMQQHQQQQSGLSNAMQLPVTYGQQQLLPIATSGANPYMILPSQPCVSSPSDLHVPVLLSEMRSQTTELRLQMGQMSEKVDRVLGKMEQSQQASSYPTMEAGMLAHTIQRIVKENEDLRLELSDKNQKLDSQTAMISDLLNRNQKFLEQSNSMWEQHNTYLESSSMTNQAKQNLEAELERARSALSQAEAQLAIAATAQAQMSAQQAQKESEEMADLRTELASQRDSANVLRTERDELKDELKRESERGNTERNESRELKQKNEDLIRKLAALPASSDLSNSSGMLSGQIKKIMNAVYRNLNKNFKAERTYDGDEIKGILASTIRMITLELMDHLEDKSEDQLEGTSITDTKEGASEQNENRKEEADVKSTQKSIEPRDEATTENQYWKPQPPPFVEGDKEDEDDWLS